MDLLKLHGGTRPGNVSGLISNGRRNVEGRWLVESTRARARAHTRRRSRRPILHCGSERTGHLRRIFFAALPMGPAAQKTISRRKNGLTMTSGSLRGLKLPEPRMQFTPSPPASSIPTSDDRRKRKTPLSRSLFLFTSSRLTRTRIVRTNEHTQPRMQQTKHNPRRSTPAAT